MLSINRKGFRVMPAISDNELAGIGLVAHNWSQLELFIDIYGRTANGGTPFDSGKGQRSTFVERARHLKEQAVAQLQPRWSAVISKTVDDALSLKGQRDQAVHGIWGAGDDGRTSVSSVNQGRLGQSRRIEYGKLREIALKIDAVNAQFFDVMVTSCEQAGSGFATGEESWKAMKIVSA